MITWYGISNIACSKFNLYIGRCIFTNRLQIQVSKFNLVIASYDIVRNDIEFFIYIYLQWLTCMVTLQ